MDSRPFSVDDEFGFGVYWGNDGLSPFLRADCHHGDWFGWPLACALDRQLAARLVPQFGGRSTAYYVGR